MPRRPLIAIVGDGEVPQDDPRYQLARQTGRHLVDAGARVLCGGHAGVMEAACRGAHEAAAYRDGDTVGVLPGSSGASANPWVDIALPTGLGHARNVLVAHADAVIAVGGAAGTLSEIAMAWLHRRPVVALEVPGWSQELADRALSPAEPARRILRARTAQEAVALALAALRASGA